MSETTSRVLQLLGLLQSRRVWTGEELAERLGVTTRSVRRDVERLRDLGYPVHASKGHGGGYQLGAGAALPPLLLDPDEAVAMAVCLRLAAGGSVAGVGESALRALSKLDQVMPSRLRSQVLGVHDATVTLAWNSADSPVEPDVLMTLARACRDREHVSASYVDRAGSATERRLEPYQLVTTGKRWYLLAFDRDRQDWRSLRLDRMDDVRAVGSTFVAREAPDAAAYVQRSISVSPVPLYRPRPVSGARARCRAAFFAVIGDDRGRRTEMPASSQRAPTTRSGWCSISRRSAPSSRCSSHPRWCEPSNRWPSGCGGRRSGRDVRAWPRSRAGAGVAAATGDAPRNPRTAGPARVRRPSVSWSH